jgi:hypothetical protein
MIFWRDVAVLSAFAIVTLGVSALIVRSYHNSPSEPLGYLHGTVLSYAVVITEEGGTRGFFDLSLDRGEDLRVRATGQLVPGDRVCVRAVRRGKLVEGHLVPLDRCAAP